MKKPDPRARVNPGADRLQNRPLDTQAADPQDVDPTQPSNQGDMRLPHEHDESPDLENGKKSAPPPRQVVEQAASDITRGLRDTERRGTPSDVPAPGPSPENTPGGEVPAAGIDRRSTAGRAEQMQKPRKP
jgi:hypothetical protein